MTIQRLFLALLWHGAAACSLAGEAASDTNATRFVVALKDGSALLAAPLDAGITLKTSYATMDIPFERIAKAEFGEGGQSISLNLANGDRLQGAATTNVLNLGTILGDISIPLENVSSIANTAGRPRLDDNPENRRFCVNNLRMIDAAKEQWAMATRMKNGAQVQTNGVLQFIKGAKFPVCPSGGAYDMKPIGAAPECSVPGHELR